MATEHLLAQGRRRIAFAGHESSRPTRTSKLRIAGYQQALEDAGIAPEPAAAHPERRDLGRRRRARGRRGARRAACASTALVCRDDLAAIGALRALQERGLHVPDDVAVTGWDNTPMTAVTYPSLTSVAPDMRGAGLARGRRCCWSGSAASTAWVGTSWRRSRSSRGRARPPRPEPRFRLYSAAWIVHANGMLTEERRVEAATAQDGRYPRPQLVRAGWLDLSGPWTFAFDDDDRGRRRALGRRPGRSTGRSSRCRSRPSRRRRASATPASTPSSGTSAPSLRDERPGRRAASLPATSVPSTTAARCGSTAARPARHEGGSHPVLARHHRPGRRDGRRLDHRPAPRTTRPMSPSRAASRTGATTRTPSGTTAPPASGSRCGSRPAAGRPHRAAPLGHRRARRRGHRAAAPEPARAGRDDRAHRGRARRRDARPTRRDERRRAASSWCRSASRVRRNGQAYEELLWSPEHPRSSTRRCACWCRTRRRTSCRSYLGLRSAAVEGGRFLLNDRPFYVRSVLNQGYWPRVALGRAVAPTPCAPRRSSSSTSASTPPACTRSTKTRASCSGPTSSACWSGARRRPPTRSRRTAVAPQHRASGPRSSTATGRIPRSSPGCRSTRAGASSTSPTTSGWCRTRRRWCTSRRRSTRRDRSSRTTAGSTSTPTSSSIHDYDHDPARVAERYATARGHPRCASSRSPGGG